jgi:hypothetical protein
MDAAADRNRHRIVHEPCAVWSRFRPRSHLVQSVDLGERRQLTIEDCPPSTTSVTAAELLARPPASIAALLRTARSYRRRKPASVRPRRQPPSGHRRYPADEAWLYENWLNAEGLREDVGLAPFTRC